MHLRLVLQKLRQSKFFGKLSKSNFLKLMLPFLGHLVSGDGIRVDPAKTAAVNNWPEPKIVPAVQSFLGFGNYFQHFLDHFGVTVVLGLRVYAVRQVDRRNHATVFTVLTS